MNNFGSGAHTHQVQVHPNCRKTRGRESSKSCNNAFLLKTNFWKPFHNHKFSSLILTTQIRCAPIDPSPTEIVSDINSTRSKHTSLLVETYHDHRGLKILLEKLEKKDSSPLQILREEGDWSKQYFWAVVRFLNNDARYTQIIQIFDMWKNIEKSRINELNYNKIICLLSEEGMMDDALSVLQDMKIQGLKPSLETYNPIIHGFSKEGKFSDALHFISEMKAFDLEPDAETYDGLIQAYGKFKMYDEMGMCVKRMESNGCSPDQITCNILIQEYSRSGILQRMEKVYQRMLSKRMRLQSSTLVAMLEAYTTFGMVDKMETFCRKLLNSKTPLEDDLIRKMAEVYINNFMFSRLEDLGLELNSAFGKSDLVWCLRLLSYACLLSRKGMDIIVREMQDAKVHWNVSVANIIMLAYVKMKDFKHLRILLSQFPTHRVKPDIVTIGILFDANRTGFDSSGALESWRRMGYLYRAVEMKTDSLVITAFGKGHFLKSCEEMYTSMPPDDRERQTWTYHNLVYLLSKHIFTVGCMKTEMS